jgi:hypothetical protein
MPKDVLSTHVLTKAEFVRMCFTQTALAELIRAGEDDAGRRADAYGRSAAEAFFSLETDGAVKR